MGYTLSTAVQSEPVWDRSDQKHPVRLWLWTRPDRRFRWLRRKCWCSADGFATGNQSDRLLTAALEVGDAWVQFYPPDHRPVRLPVGGE